MVFPASTSRTFTLQLHLNSINSLGSFNSFPQSTVEVLWEKTYGGAGDDRAFYLTSLADGYLVVGSSTSLGAGNTDGWIIRTDIQGNILWNKTYGGKSGDEFRYVEKTNDGFLLVGNTFSFGNGESDAWIVKINEQGNILWNKTIGGKDIDKFLSATETSDGFVFAGLTYSFGNGSSDAWIIKTDLEGNILWNKTYGGPEIDAARSIIVTEDHDYVIAGYTKSKGHGKSDFWLIKINGNGNLVWEKTYGYADSEEAYALAKSEDGYIVVGYTNSLGEGVVDALILKTDLNGSLLWEKTFGGTDWDMPNVVLPSKEWGYIIAGYTFSFGKGQRDFWLFKIDETGNILWSCTHGREGFEEAYSLVEVDNNEFVIAGWTNSVGNGEYDYYIVKIRVLGSPENLFSYYNLLVLGIIALFLFVALGFYLNKRRKAETREN